MSRNGRVLALAAGLALVAGPALALESLSGVYDAKVKCSGIDGGTKGKQKTTVQMAIADQGAGSLLIDFAGLQTGVGFALTDVQKPDTGTMSGVACTLLPDSIDGWTLQTFAKVKAGTDKATLKGTLIILDEAGGQAAACKLNAKRISVVTPKLSVCPAAP
jgi:hypothetical protein